MTTSNPSGNADIPCVGAVILDEDGRILLIKRGHEPARGKWSIPGGRVEAGESAEDAVHREIREETGLSITLVREVGTVYRDAPGGGRYCIRDFLATVAPGQIPVSGDDADEAAFCTLDEALVIDTSAGLLQTLADWGVFPPPSWQERA